MAIVVLTFIVILGIILGAYYAFVVRPERGERSKLLGRLGKTEGHEPPAEARRPRASGRQAERRPGGSGMLSRAKGCPVRSSG